MIETNYDSDELSHQNADNKDFLSAGDVLHCPGLILQPFSSSDLYPSSYLILGVTLFLKNKDEKLRKSYFSSLFISLKKLNLVDRCGIYTNCGSKE